MTTDLNKLDIFPWNKNFETGIKLIDDQHRVLINLLNKLAGCLIIPNVDEIHSVFDELVAYAEYHFIEEEKVWSEYFSDDSWMSSHQMRHAEFLPRIMDIKDKFDLVALPDLIDQSVHFLIRWLAFHIIDNDMRMAIAIREINKGISQEEAKSNADKQMAGSMRVLLETVLKMYDLLSTRTMDLMRERNNKLIAEAKTQATNAELQKTLAQLEMAMAEIKTLKGTIPICAYCHAIRDEKGDWDKLESYISSHSDAMFSHGICPTCYDRVRKEDGLS